MEFTKQENCFPAASHGAELTKIADTLSEKETAGRLRQLWDRWIYSTCLCFALDLDEQKKSTFQINILVFACWYWRLDAGGPTQRDLQRSHTDGAFLFPQMTSDPDLRKEMGEDQWRPGFVDYLFLAFNTSTAFSPTDVPVLSRWAKTLMMIQASISLATIALLAARAVNIL